MFLLFPASWRWGLVLSQTLSLKLRIDLLDRRLFSNGNTVNLRRREFQFIRWEQNFHLTCLYTNLPFFLSSSPRSKDKSSSNWSGTNLEVVMTNAKQKQFKRVERSQPHIGFVDDATRYTVHKVHENASVPHRPANRFHSGKLKASHLILSEITSEFKL
jgi:hypothetical protein